MPKRRTRQDHAPNPPLRPATLCLPDRAQCNSLSTHVLSILPFLPFFASSHPIFIIFLNFFNVYQFSQLFSTALVEKNQKCCSGCTQEHCLHFLNSFSQPFSIFLNQPLFSQYLSFLLSFSIFLNFSQRPLLRKNPACCSACAGRSIFCIFLNNFLDFSQLFSTSLNTPLFLNQPSFSQPTPCFSTSPVFFSTSPFFLNHPLFLLNHPIFSHFAFQPSLSAHTP